MPSFDATYEGQLLALLTQTLEQSPEDPRTFLEEQRIDPAMIDDVLEMLQDETELDDFLETPALCRLQDLLPMAGLPESIAFPGPPTQQRGS